MPERPDIIKRLSHLDIDEVSLVRRGANPHADVLISKADEEAGEAEEETSEKASKADPQPQNMHAEKPLGDEEEEDEEKLETSPSDEEEARKGFFSHLVGKLFGDSTTTSASSDNIDHVDDTEFEKHDGHQFPAQGTFGQGVPQPGLGMQQPPTPQGFPGQQGMPTGMVPGAAAPMPGQQGVPQASGAPLPTEVIEYIKQLEAALAQKTGGEQSSGQQEEEMSNPFGKSGEGEEQEGQELEFLQELAKSLEDEDARENIAKAMELVEKANERAEEAERIAKEEQEHRLNREYVELAKSYAGLPVSPEEFGPVLKRLHDHLEEEDIEVLSKVFEAKSEEMESLFGEFGKVGGADNSDVFTQVEKQAEEISKSEGISAEQARARVLESNPKLYDEYLAESR